MSKAWVAQPINAKWRRTRRAVLARANYQCEIQGPHCTGVATQADHILGRAVSDDPADCRAACVQCNSRYVPASDPDPRPRTDW